MTANDKWQQIVSAIPEPLSAHFLSSKAELGASGLVVYLPSNQANVEQIQKQIEPRYVLPKVQKFFGDVAINYQVSLPSMPEVEETLDDYQGVYHNPENAIIQPEKTEWSATQYYRRNWRPLLGPTLSELVRELRQRCHFKSNRNKFETTYKSLASALGVSTRTIERALKRDSDGKFKNEYLHYFIADVQVIKTSNGQSGICTKGTRFIVYLDDTLTPEDRRKLRDRQNVG